MYIKETNKTTKGVKTSQKTVNSRIAVMDLEYILPYTKSHRNVSIEVMELSRVTQDVSDPT